MKLEKFLEEGVGKVDLIFKRYESVGATYVNMCDLFMFSKDDPKRKDTALFFKFFNEFLDAVEKAMPKPEKKASSSASKLKKAGGLVINAAELRNVQAKMGRTASTNR